MASGPGATRAVFFDVDFTLIYPGPDVPGRRLSRLLRPPRRRRRLRWPSTARSLPRRRTLETDGDVYDPGIFVEYTMRIIEAMGGTGAGVERAARDIYDEWSACHHFEMYEDVPDVLRELHARRLQDRAHLEHAALADGVPDPLRARGSVCGDCLVVRPRLHEAASAASSRRRCVRCSRATRGGDGGGQPARRHRRRARPRHARRCSSRVPGTSIPRIPVPTRCRSSARCASCRRCCNAADADSSAHDAG